MLPAALQQRPPPWRVLRRPCPKLLRCRAAGSGLGSGASGSERSVESALSQLDSLLGPALQQATERQKSGARAEGGAPTAAAGPAARARPSYALREPPTSTTDLSGLTEPRSRPDISTAMYYLVLLVYASLYAAELLNGDEAAAALRANLANDHGAVASGDALRLFTSAFVTTSIRQLGVTLLCLFTVGSELESLLGSGVFWALLCLSVISGGFADAALSPQLISDGPAPIVASVAAALLALHIKNWRIENQLQQLKTRREEAMTPGALANGGSPSLARAKLRAMVLDLAGGPPPRLFSQEDKGAKAAAGTGLMGAFEVDSDEEELEETTFEFLEGLWAPTFLLPREAKEFTTLAGLAAGSVSAVLDAAGGSGDYTSIAGSFVFGGSLGYLLAPKWRVNWELASKEGGSGAGGPGSALGAGGAESVSSLDANGGEYWRPRLYDAVQGRARANTIVGATAGLYAALGIWLLTN